MIRFATVQDLPALTAIENRCFETDRLSPRSFRHLLTKGNAAVVVDERRGAMRGYAAVLFNRATSLARLYSIAVDPDWREQGIGQALVAASERIALEHNAAYLRLEVAVDNKRAQAIYRKAGYRTFAVQPDYYEDHGDALRLEKTLVAHLPPAKARVPYYAQTLEITCGPACLMMGMKALDTVLRLDRMLELRLWREATSIYMTSGPGGCGPLGLALSAWNRGFSVDLYISDGVSMLVDSVRSAEKREVIALVHEDFLDELAATDVAMHYEPLGLAGMRKRFDRGEIPVVLISSYRLTREKSPHWVVVAGLDDRFVYVHDPYIDEAEGRTKTDCAGIPIAHEEFERMTRYGRAKQFAALVLGRREKGS